MFREIFHYTLKKKNLIDVSNSSIPVNFQAVAEQQGCNLH